MEATQLIDDSILEESEEEDGEMRKEKRGEPLAKLRVLKNEHISETELPLYQGENVLGRNPNSCSLPLMAPSVSKQHTVISISMFRGNRCRGNVAGMETEALVWDLGSMNGTRKGRTKLTPHVRYALTDGECVVIADIPCQYVSVDQRGGQGHMQNLTNAHSGRGRRTGPDRKAQFRGSPSGQGLGRETGTPKTERPTEGRGVNGEMGAPLSTELGGKGKTRAIHLSLEQTPTKPERTLVPESESDSDGDREGRRDKRGKYFVSDSDSHVSSPTCSTFLSPTNKVIPEGEDDRPNKVVSVSEEEGDMDGPRQQPRRRRAQVIVDDSEEEEEEEEGKEGTAALGEKGPGKRTRGKEDVSVVNQVSQAERDAPMVSTEDTFNMDSDTDVEGEEEMGLSAPVKSVKPPATTEPPTTDSDPGQIHMDSDTDVEEGDTMDVDAKLMLTAADVERKPVDSVPVVQPTEIHLDSDTDVDDDVVVSDSATNVTSFISDPAEKPDDPAPAVPPVEFHPDTDTDVEEEDTDTHSKTVPESDSSGIRTGIAGPQEILLDSDTDEEDNPFTPPASSRTAELLNPPTSVGPAAAAPLEIRSDSDTDLEEDATQTMNLSPPNVATVTEDTGLASRQAVLPSPTTMTIDLRSQDSDADTDAEEERLEPKPPRCRPPAGMVPESDLSEPSDFRVDSDTEEDGPGEAGQGQTACRLREGAVGPGLLPLGGSPGPHQKCSTPLASSVQEEMETQAFFSPSDSFRHPALHPVLRPTAALSCSASDSQEDDDFVVAETQSFVLEAQNQGHQSSLPVEPTLDAMQPYGLEPLLGEDREEQPSRGSFQLGLSDSRDLSLQARDQASESPQAFSSPDRDSDLEATQTYGSGGGSEEPGLGQRSVVFRRNRQVDSALEATQAYAAQPRSDTEEEEETPTTSNVATTETLPMSADEEEEEGLVGAMPSTPVRRGRSGGVRERKEEEQETQTGDVLINQYLSTAQTLNMVQESDDEEKAKPDSPRGRGQSQEQTVDEEETQTVCSYLSTAETQPMFTDAAAEDDDNEEEELKPPSPRRRGRSQRGRVGEEETQPSEFLTSSHISTAETQPMGTCHTEEEEEEDTKDKGRAQRGRGKESEAGTSGVSSRGRRGARGEEEEEESAEPPKTQTRGKGKAVNTAGGRGRRGKGKAVNTAGGRGRRGKVLPEEGESEKEEEVEVVEQGRRGRKSVKQQKEGEKERLEREQREEEEGIEKERLEREQREEEEGIEKERLEREQREEEEGIEKERLEREQREEEEGIEKERLEREQREEEEGIEKERLEREQREEEEGIEKERLEREQREEEEGIEKERLEREQREEEEGIEKERLEREQREEEEGIEKERLEREQREEEEGIEKERLEREQREEEEGIEKERLEREQREEEEGIEKERLEREQREEEEGIEKERLEREQREEEEGIEKERLEREQREEEEGIEKERLEREQREEEEGIEKERLEREQREEEEGIEKERLEREQREEEEGIEKERLEREQREEEEGIEKERLEREQREEEEGIEKERLEREQREEEEGIEKERREQAEKERLQKEKVESERVMKEQQDRERMEQELKEQDERLEREREKREETGRMEREKREQEERERLERERKEREEQERLEREKERLEREEKEIMERKEREERKRLEWEKKEKQEKLELKSMEREALVRLERERVEREEKERIEGEQAENERLEKERKEILEKEKMEREEMKKQERERLKKNKEEKERLDREIKERNLKEKLEREKEREKREAEEKEKEIKERQVKEQGEKQTKKDNENEPKTSTRGRRANTRRTVMVPPTTEPQTEPDILSSQPEPVPASITRSRSNSVSSERSTSNIGTQGSRGRGGRKTTSTTESAPGPDNPTRNSTRRRTLVGTVVAPPTAVEVTVQDILSSEQFVARRTRSRSSSTNSHSSLNSEVSTGIAASVSSQSKGRGGGRRKTGTESVSPSNRQSEQPPALKPTARGRRSQKVEGYGPHPEINEKADSQEAGGTTRGQKKTDKTNEPDPVVADEETTPAQVTEDSPAPRGNGRGRGRGGQKDNTPESTTTTAGGETQIEEGVGSKTGGKGRKRGLEEEESSEFKVPRGKAKVQRGGRHRAAEEGEKEEKPASTPAKRGRASTAQVKKIAEEEKSMERHSEKMEEEEAGAVQRKVRGRQSTVHIKKEEESVLDSNSVVPQTPTGKGRGKRRAPVESSPFAKTPRSSSASPLSSLSSPGTLGRARASTPSYKVLFTGVVDEEGGKVVSRLGGSLAKGVADMTHLVTDRIRRTVKFLCAVARGVPVVTTDWLDKCGKVGSFLPTDRYLVKDREQENKFSFCLEESLRTASTQPLLQGYEVHVTRSVLPEPAQMKDIIVCSGAHFLSKMPSSQKAQARTLVISCGEDWSLCAPALSASLPVLSAEFLLTGILQQRVDLVTHVLSAPKPRALSAPKPRAQPGAKGQASGRKRT